MLQRSQANDAIESYIIEACLGCNLEKRRIGNDELSVDCELILPNETGKQNVGQHRELRLGEVGVRLVQIVVTLVEVFCLAIDAFGCRGRDEVSAH